MCSLSGRGTVVTGRVERGVINVNDEIEITVLKTPLKQSVQELRCSENH